MFFEMLSVCAVCSVNSTFFYSSADWVRFLDLVLFCTDESRKTEMHHYKPSENNHSSVEDVGALVHISK